MESTKVDVNQVPNTEVSTIAQVATLLIHALFVRLRATCNWMNRHYEKQKTSRRLKILETLSLGEKRFVSIMQVDGTEYLIALNMSTISILATLSVGEPSPEIVKVKSRRKVT